MLLLRRTEAERNHAGAQWTRTSGLNASGQAVRRSARQLIALAADRLLDGTDLDRIQARYVVPGLALLEEAEVQAVLAAGGDERALDEIERIIRGLDELNRALEAEGLR